MLLKITSAIRNEWQVRGISDVVPALAEIAWDVDNVIFVDAATAREIRADCAFQMDPRAVDANLGERSAYRALLRQIDSASAASSEKDLHGQLPTKNVSA